MINMLRRRVDVLIRYHIKQFKNRKYTTESGIIKSPHPDVSQPNIPLHKYVFQNVNKWPNHTAVECGVSGKKYTYSQLLANCKRLATSFRKYGLKKGDIIAVILPNTSEFPIAYLGALEAGLCVSTVNPAYTKDEIIHQLKDCKAEWIICHPSNLPVVLEVGNIIKSLKIICTHDLNGRSPQVSNNTILFEEMIDSSVEMFDSADDVDLSEVALIAYSSGTTGLPKGACLSHNSITVNIEQVTSPNCRKIYETHGDDQCVVPGILPFFHCYGNVIVLLQALRVGSKVITLPKFDPKSFLMTLENNKNLYLFLVPPIVFFLGNSNDVTTKHISRIKEISTGAGPCGAQDIEKVKNKTNGPVLLSQGYGLTEASPVLTLYKPSGSDDNYSTIGHLVPNTSAKVISLDNGKTLSQGKTGELLFKGPQIMVGYLNNKKATDETIDVDGWLHTGDVGYFDQDGLFYIKDRLKELIKVKGFQVAPAELEDVLRQHPEILEAGVVGAPCETSGEVPVAFVQTVPGSKISEEEIKHFLASRVTKYKHLSSVRFLEAIPKTAAGKILRKHLKTKI